MICQPCMRGAQWNRTWRAGGGMHFLSLANQEHARCAGCVCQHATGVDSLVVSPL